MDSHQQNALRHPYGSIINCRVPKRPVEDPTPEEIERRRDAAVRLREAVAYCGSPSTAKLAATATLSRGTVDDALEGARKTDSKTWQKLAVVLRHRVLWLQHGHGERFMTEAEAQALALELKIQSQSRLAPVSSDGLARWLTEWGDLLSITPFEREWMHRVQWLDPAQRYSDMVYKSVLDALRMMQEKSAPRLDQASIA